ncbi:class I SAM-dependent methyltransferase [Streptomyces sp. NPDC047821]|uniref:class I SAM-dependent methyltransferase n=1 Tax=Streptomyces sp. NPDC047821 TaxID=3365488 RepID=UPI003721D62A
MNTTRVHDDERLAGVYQSGNEMPEESLRDWTRLIGSFAGHRSPAIVEVGAGTGMFCAAMARWLDPVTVVGVDPSAAMLDSARRVNAHPVVRYVAGTAEALPVGDGRFDLALLSRVIHHLPDRARAAREVARVLRPGGAVVVRTTFRERLDALVYHYWPRLRALDEERFPSEAEVVGAFTAAGLTLRTVTSFARPVTSGLREYHARMVSRPQSKFLRLTDAEFAAGLRRLAADARAEPETGPETGPEAGPAPGLAPGPTRGPVRAPAPVEERYDVVVLTA